MRKFYLTQDKMKGMDSINNQNKEADDNAQRKRDSQKNREIETDKIAPKKIPRPYLAYLKKVGFSIWLSVMIIGGILAFVTSLVLL